MGIKAGKVVIENIELLPPPWFGVSHGVDNYEEAIRLDEVQAFRASHIYNDKAFTTKVLVMLKGGSSFEFTLSEEGYSAVLDAIAALAEAGG